VGTWLLLWPALWALWISGEGHPNEKVLIVFVLGVIVMRQPGASSMISQTEISIRTCGARAIAPSRRGVFLPLRRSFCLQRFWRSHSISLRFSTCSPSNSLSSVRADGFVSVRQTILPDAAVNIWGFRLAAGACRWRLRL